MSNITDVLLSFSNREESTEQTGSQSTHRWPIVDNINTWLKEHRHEALTRLNDVIGTEKTFAANLYGGSYNNLNVEGFLFLIKHLGWKHPEAVQIFIRRKDEELFSIFRT